MAEKRCKDVHSGCLVKLVGLHDTSLNEKTGDVLKFLDDKQRWAVRVGPRTVSVKPENVEPLTDSSFAVRKRLRLCKFGACCWRPDCHFAHQDECARAHRWKSHWDMVVDHCELAGDIHGEANYASQDESNIHGPKKKDMFDDSTINTKIRELEKCLDNILAEVNESSLRRAERVDVIVNEERMKVEAECINDDGL